MFQHTFLYFKSIESVLILFLDPKRPQIRPFDQERHLVEIVDFFTKIWAFFSYVILCQLRVREFNRKENINEIKKVWTLGIT